MIDLRLDHTAPTPLYHQIVQAIRWRIGTGVLRPGDPLPAIRDGAEQWGVNYHTVRRAYHDLATAGWVDSSPGIGTRVAQIQPAEAIQRGDLIDEWLAQITATAQRQYGLSAETLATLIRERQRTLQVVVVECNRHQAVTLSRQIERTLPVFALPWSLEEPGDPPDLPIIGTYFHHGEMRTRWPHRLGDMHFVALTVGRGIEERVAAAATRRDARLLWLVERDIGTAHEMATAISAVLAPRFEIRPVVAQADELLNSLPENQLVLVAPRLWDELPPVVRADERVLAVEAVIIEHDLQRVWRSLRAGLIARPNAAENRL